MNTVLTILMILWGQVYFITVPWMFYKSLKSTFPQTWSGVPHIIIASSICGVVGLFGSLITMVFI